MDVGMIGLGKMGANMAERLVRGGHRVVGYARTAQTVQEAASRGIEGATSLVDLVQRLRPPRVVWLMVPSGAPVDDTIAALLPSLGADDVLVDGGNSYYRDTLRRGPGVEAKGVHWVDCGTSGGIWGLAEGYSLMIGGDPAIVERLRPVFATLAPGADRGWGRVGPVGAGHFVKMVHNGIEYGLMQAYAEGFAILDQKHEFQLHLDQVAEIWRSGSVVRSWLLDLAAEALHENPALTGVAPFVVDSGEGRWTVTEAIDLGVPAPVITLALEGRLRSRQTDPFAEKLLAVLRQKFGGHAVKAE
jgi:6-phosphogluconate dehydrogenase